MNRRQFLGALLGTAAAAALIPRHEFLFASAKQKWIRDAEIESLTIGDVFSIEGVYAVNPISYADTGILQRFVVTANVSSESDPAIWPMMIPSGQYQTVNALPADDARLIPEKFGVFHGSPLATGAGQTGRTITTSGWALDTEDRR